VPAQTSTDDPTGAVFAAWRAESARLVGALTRMTGDVGLAEDLAQDALVAALEQWPTADVPANPIGWLMTTAKRRGIDHFRRAERLRRKIAELEHARGGGEEEMPDLDGQVDYIEDDVLRLIFLSCHPCLTAESRAALTLRLVAGLTTAEIARAFLASESTLGQRIWRAKKTLSEAHAEFELPTGPERTRRLDDVMAVIYLIFNEGYTATTGKDWMRPDLAKEAIRLARLLAALAPDEPEVLALQALLGLQGSRMAARLDEDGAPVLLEAQDRKRWDRLLIRRDGSSGGLGRRPGPRRDRAARRGLGLGHQERPGEDGGRDEETGRRGRRIGGVEPDAEQQQDSHQRRDPPGQVTPRRCRCCLRRLGRGRCPRSAARRSGRLRHWWVGRSST
jgi:RNA polymerase sigma factor (sigma-70 family)